VLVELRWAVHNDSTYIAAGPLAKDKCRQTGLAMAQSYACPAQPQRATTRSARRNHLEERLIVGVVFGGCLRNVCATVQADDNLGALRVLCRWEATLGHAFGSSLLVRKPRRENELGDFAVGDSPGGRAAVWKHPYTPPLAL